MKIQNERGMALVMSLMTVVVLLVFGSIFVLRTVQEWNTAVRERRLAQAYYIAEGGAQAALGTLNTLINTDMLNTINATNPATVISDAQSYVTSGDGLGMLQEYVVNSGTQQFTLDSGTGDLIHHVSLTNLGGGTYEFDIKVREKSNPSQVGPDQWDFPFYYSVETTGHMIGTDRKILLNGDFTVRVQRDNFAKYALFTNQQTLPDGSTQVWFTNKTNFAGPIHTNGRYNFALNPSGSFEGLVTQVEQTARFYNQGAPVLLDADFNGTRDVPTFHASFNRGVSNIALASAVQKQDMIDQATGNGSYTSNGIYVPNDGVQVNGGIYVQGDANIALSVDANDNAVYTVTQGSTSKIITVDETNNQTTVQTVGGSTETYSGLPDGIDDVGTIVFVNGTINSLGGTVQRDTAVTIASESDILITNHVLYSDYVPAQGNPGEEDYVPPHVSGADNVLGLVTWNGDVRIATSAPNDLNIHGTILTQNGIFQVDNYWDQSVGGRGTATLLGGVISDYYGAFGLFNGSTGQQVAGYGRNFVYDNRMLVGTSPPYFPTLNTFIAFTNDIMDKVTATEGGF